MHHGLHELVLIFGVSALVVYLFARLKQPPIAGYLISGILMGNHGLSLIKSESSIQKLAELGLIFLLFSIGIEFSFKHLLRIRRIFFLVGAAQVFITSLVITFITHNFVDDWRRALVTGFIISLSSTAIVLKLLHERREMNTPYGDLTVGTLLFQDVVTVPLLILIPYLAVSQNQEGSNFNHIDLVTIFGKIALVVSGIYFGTRHVVPKLLDKIAQTGVRELFLITVALITFGCAVIGEHLGLSLAMGAFVAGLMVSESHYGNQVVSDLVPLKEPFIALFFVSVGILLDVSFLKSNFVIILSITLAVFIIKYLVAATIARLYGLETRASAMFAIYTSQVGEFSFVMASVAVQAGILGQEDYQLILAVVVLTMLVSPSLIRSAPLLSPHLANLDPFGRVLKNKHSHMSSQTSSMNLSDHVIIIGYGMNGQNLASSLKKLNVFYAIIETNAHSVEAAKNKGDFAIFGDGSRLEVLEAVGLSKARMVVIAINDVNWIAKVVHSVRLMRPDVFLVVRCTHLRDAQMLSDYKIDELVIGEELTAKDLLNRVLLGFGLNLSEAKEAAGLANLSELASSQSKKS